MPSLYEVALTMLPGIGPVLSRKLLAHYGSAEAVFLESARELEQLGGAGKRIAASMNPGSRRQALDAAAAELDFCEREGIRCIFYHDSGYPERLKECYDAPLLLYYKGKASLNQPRLLSVVGTRKASPYGKMLCRRLMEGLRPFGPVVVSGLAYGIDVCAHTEALRQGLATIAVLGHGLERVYPSRHLPIARQMQEDGGLLTEFPHGSRLLPENFPRRNRLIAGLSEATVVVEASLRGGALITAALADDYHREVFALPGRWGDKYSEGCLQLIRRHKAQLICSPEDIAWQLGWEAPEGAREHRPADFGHLQGEQRDLARLIAGSAKISLEELALRSGISLERLYPLLLDLEIKGEIRQFPGNFYVIR